MNMTGRVFSINVGKQKGEPKGMVSSAILREDHGLEGDAHAGSGIRQVSLLSMEEIEAAEASSHCPDIDFRPGIFAENITTVNVDLSRIKVDDTLHIGSEVILKVTQIGKECHSACSIMRKVGRCIMPKQGIFAVVQKGGVINVGDRLVAQKQRMAFSWLKI